MLEYDMNMDTNIEHILAPMYKKSVSKAFFGIEEASVSRSLNAQKAFVLVAYLFC